MFIWISNKRGYKLKVLSWEFDSSDKDEPWHHHYSSTKSHEDFSSTRGISWLPRSKSTQRNPRSGSV